MFPIRRAALRFLSTPSASFAPRARTISSITATPLRYRTPTSSVLFQKRWASDETNKGDAPITQIQPTPQEEVENAIIEDNAARTVESSTEAPSVPSQPPTESAPAVAESANITEATNDAVSEESAVDTSQEAVTNATSAAAAINTIPAGASSSSAGTRSGFTGERRAADPDARNQPKPTIYIGNLFFDVTEDDLTKELSRFGQIQRVKLIRDARGLSKGFGYVTFSSVAEASKAVGSLNQQLFEGRRLYVAYATTESPPTVRTRTTEKAMNPPSKTLFIGNMSWEMTDKDLNNLFKGIKNVIDVRVAIDRRTGQPRGFAHADFIDVKSAMEGFKALEGKETYGRRLRLDYSYGSSSAPRNQAKDEGSL